MKNLKTSVAFGFAALFSYIAQHAPDQAGWAAPLASLATFLGGVFAKDANGQ